MNTNIKVTLTEDERSLIHNVYHNKDSSKMASRKEVSELVQLFIQELLSGNGQNYEAVVAKVIQKGYKYFINDKQVTGEVFGDPGNAQKNAEMSQLAANGRLKDFENSTN